MKCMPQIFLVKFQFVLVDPNRLLAVIVITTQGVQKLALSLSFTSVKFQEGDVNPEGNFSALGSKNSEIAQLLSSVPDRASLLAPSTLQSPYPSSRNDCNFIVRVLALS